MGGAGKSEEVIQKILQTKEKCICVRGNREKYIIEGMPTIVHDEKVKVSKEQLDRNEWIKKQKLWQQVKDNYIYKKNTNTDDNKKSRAIFAETIHQVCQQNGYYK